MLVAERYGIDLNNWLGLHLFIADDFKPFQFITYMFMHGDFRHILFNMFALWMFGRVLEQVWGAKRFLIYYIVAGLGAGVIQEVVQYAYYSMELSMYSGVSLGGEITVPMSEYLNMWVTVGASGAVYALLLAFAMTFPNERLFVFPIPMPIKAKYFVIFYGVLELLLGLNPNMGDNVAHFAHLGGMLFGLGLIIYWRKTGKIYGPFN